MKVHWEERLGNVSNKALEESWGQIAQAFLTHVKSHDNPGQETSWTVLSPPTGTGKTEATILYCAMLSPICQKSSQGHPGILVVTRMIKEADRIAENINRLSKERHSGLENGNAIAVAYHTQAEEDLRRKDLQAFPVLVITHKAYENALSSIESNYSPTMWEHFHDYLDRKRKLVIIDEVIDLVLDSSMNAEEVRGLLGLIPEDLYKAFRAEVYLLEKLQEYITKASGSGAVTVSASVLHSQPMLETLDYVLEGDDFFPTNFRELRESLYESPANLAPFRRSSTAVSEEARRGLDELIRDADAVWRNPWLWQAKDLGKITLRTAKLLVPDDVKGAVVLDAAAGENVFYEVFSKANRIPPIPGTRRYDNVTLHVSMDQPTGRVSLRGKKESPTHLVAELKKWAKGHSVLIVAHQDREKALKKAAKRLTLEKGFTVTVTHWGAINGLNEWREYDTIVLFGLFHRPPIWPVNIFMACQGVQTDEWLSSTGNRPFGDHSDIKEALRVGQLVTDTIQAINRIRCRQVVDVEGNCLTADVYLLLPRGPTGKAILSGIERAMPGIHVKKWPFSLKASKARSGKYEEDLIEFFRGMEPGKTAFATVKTEYSIPDSTFERIRTKVRNKSPKDDLGQAMIEHRVSYKTDRDGGGPLRAYFIKESP
jgi:hypothetical protein